MLSVFYCHKTIMFKFVVLALLIAVTTAAPAPGYLNGGLGLGATALGHSALIGGIPSITASTNSIVHSAAIVTAPVVHSVAAAPALVAAPALHGLGVAGLHGLGGHALAAPALTLPAHGLVGAGHLGGLGLGVHGLI